MKNGRRVIITIVLVAILLGAVSVGVGLMTGGDFPRDYMTQIFLKLYDSVRPHVNVVIEKVNDLWGAVRSAVA